MPLPRSVVDWLRVFGPGAVIASLTIGTGELIFSTRGGALFGYRILFLFVIMLLNPQEESREAGRGGLRWIAWLGGGVLILELFLLIRRSPTMTAGGEKLPEGFGTVAVLGKRLFTDFLLPFEIASILLLIAIVGAVVLAKREDREER